MDFQKIAKLVGHTYPIQIVSNGKDKLLVSTTSITNSIGVCWSFVATFGMFDIFCEASHDRTIFNEYWFSGGNISDREFAEAISGFISYYENYKDYEK